jgi:hypothetical protein
MSNNNINYYNYNSSTDRSILTLERLDNAHFSPHAISSLCGMVEISAKR